MTIYAMSSHQQVAVGTDHGGCGVRHDRPHGPDGQPVKLWGLDCPPCEDHLRSQPGWSTTISSIPETYDEVIDRKDWEQRGALDRDQVLALALAKLAGVELPETLRRTVSGLAPHVPGTVECGDGHENRAGAKFCAECGTAMRGQAPAPVTVTCAAGHENDAASKFCAECGVTMGAAALPAADAPPEDLAELTVNQLRSLAKQRGLDASGAKTDLLGRLRAA